MNDTQGDQRGSDTGQSSVQSEEKGSHHRLRNGFEIFTFNPKTLVSWGMLCGVISVVIASISFYQRLGTEVGGVVRTEIEKVEYNKDSTLYEKVGELDQYKKDSKKQFKQVFQDLDDLYCYAQKGKNCRKRVTDD